MTTLVACGGEDGEGETGTSSTGDSSATAAASTSSGSGGAAASTTSGATSSGSGGSSSGAGGSNDSGSGGDSSAATGAGGESGTTTGTGGAGTGGMGGSVPISDLGTPCDEDGRCPAGLMPTEFCGIAGCDVTQFCSCEIPCDEDGADTCPGGTECVTISDGPGPVCARKACSEAGDCEDSICCGQCGSQSCGGECTNGPSCESGMQL
ncbi:MAG TPA: hypothetical protein VF989_17430 [Polyangiaceae bacterium]